MCRKPYLKNEHKIQIEFSESELYFLSWAMDFLEGGPFDIGKDELRKETDYKVKKALKDLEKGIIRSVDDSLHYIVCAFCEGSGCFPDIFEIDDVETEPCPVCKGKGQNAFKTDAGNILECRFYGGNGRAWDSSGYPTGDVCQVCHGKGIILLEESPEFTKSKIIWDLFHPAITKVSKSRFESNHFADAVEAAFKEINKIIKNVVKSRTGDELDGAPLMYRAFSPNQPVIELDDPSTETGRNIQQGFMQLFAGAMVGIRNPKAHDNIIIDSSRAIHLLSLASLLMSKLDERP